MCSTEKQTRFIIEMHYFAFTHRIRFKNRHVYFKTPYTIKQISPIHPILRRKAWDVYSVLHSHTRTFPVAFTEAPLNIFWTETVSIKINFGNLTRLLVIPYITLSRPQLWFCAGRPLNCVELVWTNVNDPLELSHAHLLLQFALLSPMKNLSLD